MRTRLELKVSGESQSIELFVIAENKEEEIMLDLFSNSKSARVLAKQEIYDHGVKEIRFIAQGVRD